MLCRTPLIVGLDPGTTTAVAILDTKGNILSTHSSKNLSLSDLINKVITYGVVIAVGTDKRKSPEMVQRFCSKFGARLFYPTEDLQIKEKRELTRKFHTKNDHELDALASAIKTYNDIKVKLIKIDKLNHNNKNGLIELVVKKDISIDKAIKELKYTNNNPKLNDKLFSDEQDISKLKNQVSRYRREIDNLKRTIPKKNRVKQRRRFDINKKIDTLFNYKEMRIKSYQKVIEDLKEENSQLIKQIADMTNDLMDSNKNYLIKKLKNLGRNEFDIKKKKLRIGKFDILYIDDPNIISDKTIMEIKDKITIILYSKNIKLSSSLGMYFNLIKIEKSEFNDFGDFAIMDKELLENKLHSKIKFQNIVKQYKEEKLQQ